MPPAKKTKTKPVPSAAKINTPETSSPPEEEATASPAAVVNRASRQKSESSATVESLVVGGGIVEKGDIAVLKAGAVSEETEARRSRTHSSSLALDDVDLINAVLATASLPIGHATLLSSDNTVIPDYRAFDFPRSLHTVALPIGHATLLSLDPHTPPFDDPFGFLHAPATNQSIELFLQAEGKDLEQYAPGFRMSGYDDTNSLLAPSDEVMSHFLVSSLVRRSHLRRVNRADDILIAGHPLPPSPKQSVPTAHDELARNRSSTPAKCSFVSKSGSRPSLPRQRRSPFPRPSYTRVERNEAIVRRGRRRIQLIHLTFCAALIGIF